MREFVEDRLPRNIADDLPAEAKTWSRTSGNELSRKGLLQVLHASRERAASSCITTWCAYLARL